MPDLAEARARLVERQMRRRDIRDPRVLDAAGRVERDRFVPLDMAELAYDDAPLAIGEGQTISQPYMVALMAQAAELRPGDRVLEVGTGSGYAAALMSLLCGRVFTVERRAGLAEAAPFDAIVLAFGFYPLTAILVILLALLNDLPIMTIAYDATRLSDRPVKWDMRRVLAVASV